MINKYKIEVICKNKDYFLNKLINNNIYFYNIKNIDNKLIIIIDEDGYNKLNKIKTSYKYKVIDMYGKIKIKYLINKYLFFLISIIFGIVLNIILSKMIFKIEIIHPNKNIRDIIYSDLKREGISKYRFKVNYNRKNKIINNILNKEIDNIEWMEIEEVGVKYIVKVEMKKKNKKELELEPRNIVAKKDSMILNIEALSGEVVKKKYDYVKKGDIIISGIIHNKEEEVNIKSAVGTVYGEVWYMVNLSIPEYYQEEIVTGKSKYLLEFSFLNKNYNLFNKYKSFIKIKYNILESNILPIKFSLVKYLETIKKEEYYNINNIDNKAIEISIKNLKNKHKDKIEILSKKVLKKYRKDSKIIVEVFFKVKEDITDYELINTLIEE